MTLREYIVWSDWDRELDTMRVYNADEVDALFASIREAVAAERYKTATILHLYGDCDLCNKYHDEARAALDALMAQVTPAAPATAQEDRARGGVARVRPLPEAPAVPPAVDDCGGEHLEDGCGCKVCREGPSA